MTNASGSGRLQSCATTVTMFEERDSSLSLPDVTVCVSKMPSNALPIVMVRQCAARGWMLGEFVGLYNSQRRI